MNQILKNLVFNYLGYIFIMYTQAKDINVQTSSCNPVNLRYRFCHDDLLRLEAAEPGMVVLKNGISKGKYITKIN